jgi:hypothetical protein
MLGAAPSTMRVPGQRRCDVLSVLNSLSGLSAADLLTLFATRSSSSSSPMSASAVQSTSTEVSASGSGAPATAIKALLAQAQIEQTQTGTLGGGSASLVSANITIAAPGAFEQISNALSEINTMGLMTQDTVDPATNNGISTYINPITVTASDAVNITIANGALSATAIQGAAFPSGLPSLTSIQQAISDLNWDNTGAPLSSAYKGSLTLVKLPDNTLGTIGGNIITFGGEANGESGASWALVLPQDAAGVQVSDAQIND